MLKINVKRISLISLSLLGYILLLPLWRKFRKDFILVLRYHSISEFRRHEVNVKPEIFERQMEYLAKNFKAISLTEFIDFLNNGKEIPPKVVFITFDDGYKDNFINAYPALKKLNLPATIFLSVGYIGTAKILPHDRNDEYMHNRLLNWQEAKQMSSNRISFGSHSLNHANLGKIFPDELREEIEESKKMIENKLEQEVLAISYPFGLISDFNTRVIEGTKQAGYTCGFTAMYGVNTEKTDLFRLRRIGIEASDNMFTFRAKLNGALDLLMLKETRIVQIAVRAANRILGV
jgi:peptidoglycan/xylan/chitin deacetylase (PgdA/CDA1 family)